MIFITIGTKAQLIKMAPLIRELRHQSLPYRFILTGQHQETMTELYEAFELNPPDDFFIKPKEANSYSKLLYWLVKSSLSGFNKLSKSTPHDMVLVHGDTLSTLQCALIGKIKRLKVVHIEAGLRSFDNFNPFPEEIIRRWVTALADLYVTQDDTARQNLARYPDTVVLNTRANTMMDALRFAQKKLNAIPHSDSPTIKYGLASLHRNENLSNTERFNCLMNTVLEANQKLPIKFILHPVTRQKIDQSQWRSRLTDAGVELVERMDYLKFTDLMLKAEFLITDGGSNQEEASYIGIPCLVMRDASERTEGLGAQGNAVLSHYEPQKITTFIKNYSQYRTPPQHNNTDVSAQIVAFLRQHGAQ